MFNMGFMEMVVIGVLALILIGPKQLPEMAKVIARTMNEFKKATSELSGGLLEIKKELKEPFKEGLDAFKQIQQDAQSQVSRIREDIQKHVTQATSMETGEDHHDDHLTESKEDADHGSKPKA